MSEIATTFGINTYSYTLSHSAADCLRHLVDQGFDTFEIMMFPGHLWPSDMTPDGLKELRSIIESNKLRIISLNMPNIDINVAGMSQEMREYSLGLVSQFVAFTGEISAENIIVGPGKGNPLFPAPHDLMIGHFHAALDRLYPIAQKAGTTLLVENMPFAFLPGARELMQALEKYGNEDIHVIYDVANGHFIGSDPAEEMRLIGKRLKIAHFSDTNQKVYKHDTVGLGDVPFADYPSVLKEIGYIDKPVLEIISQTPDQDILDSCKQLYALGYR